MAWLSPGSASIDPCPAHAIAARRTARAFRLGQPLPCTSPISDAPCRPAGTASPLPGSAAAGSGVTSRDASLEHSPVGPRLPTRMPFRVGATANRDAFGRATTNRGKSPVAAPCTHSLIEHDARRHTPFSPWDRRLVRQHGMRSVPRPAPRRQIALRLFVRLGARCVGPTSAISRLRNEYPRLVGSRRATSLRSRARGFACFTAERFTSAERPR